MLAIVTVITTSRSPHVPLFPFLANNTQQKRLRILHSVKTVSACWPSPKPRIRPPGGHGRRHRRFIPVFWRTTGADRNAWTGRHFWKRRNRRWTVSIRHNLEKKTCYSAFFAFIFGGQICGASRETTRLERKQRRMSSRRAGRRRRWSWTI